MIKDPQTVVLGLRASSGFVEGLWVCLGFRAACLSHTPEAPKPKPKPPPAACFVVWAMDHHGSVSGPVSHRMPRARKSTVRVGSFIYNVLNANLNLFQKSSSLSHGFRCQASCQKIGTNYMCLGNYCIGEGGGCGDRSQELCYPKPHTIS